MDLKQEQCTLIQPQNRLVFIPVKQEPNVASTTLSIHNPTANPVLYKPKGNDGSSTSKCTTGFGSFQILLLCFGHLPTEQSLKLAAKIYLYYASLLVKKLSAVNSADRCNFKESEKAARP